jgi:DNA-binding response OmpR family regulator
MSIPCRPLRILVVDDNVDAADMLGQILQLDGHALCLAYDAHEGLAAARAFCPDVAVLDIGMPGMNGFELAGAIRAEAGLAQVRLVALSGWATVQDRERARNVGFDVYLTKPVGIDTLRLHVGAMAGPLPDSV